MTDHGGWPIGRASKFPQAMTIDDRWHAPHFEKMLYDNALLLPPIPPLQR